MHSYKLGKPIIVRSPSAELGWTLEDLKKKMEKTALENSQQSAVDVVLQQKLKEKYPQHQMFDIHQSAQEASNAAEIQEMSNVSTLSQRYLCNPLQQTRETAVLFPFRPDLRVKRSWRYHYIVLLHCAWTKNSVLSIVITMNVDVSKTWRMGTQAF
jgi:hypothetical protein